MSKELESIIEIGREERNIEFKRDENWQTLKDSIIKSAMAMANRRGGGYIVIGMEQLDDNTFKRTGVCKVNLTTFDRDRIEENVNEYAEPSVRLYLEVLKIEKYNNPFVFIIIDEFLETPIICKRDNREMEKGAIYYRSSSKNESSRIKHYEDMRELINLAILKGVRKNIENLNYFGLKSGSLSKQNDEEKFKKQRGE